MTAMQQLRSAALALSLVACGGTYGGGPATTPTTTPAQAEVRGVPAAGLPYQVLDARTGHQVDERAFWDRLAAMRVVCVGEEHPNPHDHWVQLQVVQHLVKRGPRLALGMEMFQRPFQGVLDDYAAKKIDADTLRSRAGWDDRWGYDWNLYAPMIDAVVAAGGALVALNAEKELTKQVAHHGLASLPPDQRARVPELNLEDARHRAWFDALMESMGGGAAHAKASGSGSGAGSGAGADSPMDELSPENVYTVQVIWDETMADTAVKWLAAHPGQRMVILAGKGHCHDSAIVDRIKRRGVADVVSIRTVIDDGEGSVAAELAEPMNDYLVVLEPPADVKAKMRAAEDSGE